MEQENHQIADLSEKHEKLRSRNSSLEEALVQLEEEMDDTANKNKETVANLHSRIDQLETQNRVLDSRLFARDLEVATLKKEIKTKDDIIQNLNKGFNQKVNEIKLEIVKLEKFKQKKVKEEKEAMKKEKKRLKKNRKEEEEAKDSSS